MSKIIPKEFAEFAALLACKRGMDCTSCHGAGWTALNRSADGSMQLLTCRHVIFNGSEYAKLKEYFEQKFNTFEARADRKLGALHSQFAERLDDIEARVRTVQTSQEVFYRLTFRYVVTNFWNRITKRNKKETA